MMMTLRKNMKYILGVVLFAFVITLIFSWGMGGFRNKASNVEKGIIAIVGKEEVYFEDLQKNVNYLQTAMKQQKGITELSKTDRDAIWNMAWQQKLKNIIYAQEIERLNITVTNSEIAHIALKLPPEWITSNQSFHKDGQFDLQQYQNLVKNPQNKQYAIDIERNLRQMILHQKLENRIQSTAHVTDNEAWEDYRLKNDKVNAKYIFFDPNDTSLENITVTESEVGTFYNTHKEEFQEPEKRVIQYILLEIKPSKEDSASTLNDILELKEEIESGSDFGKIAKERSHHQGSAPDGGDLGFIGRGTMDNAFNEAAFNAPIGEVVGPVETNLGLHLIKILDRDDKNDQVHARHILLKYETSRETIENLWKKARNFYEGVTKTKGIDFNKIAKEENHTVIETDPFIKGEFVHTLGIVPSINSLTFNEDIGWVCQPRSVIENIIVFQIKEIQKSHISDLKEVESTIRLRIQREKRKNRSGEICIQIREKIKQGSEFEKIAEENSLTILETGLFGLQSMISRVGQDPSFSGTALRLNVGDVSSPVESDRGFYLIKIIDRMDADREHFQVEKNSLKLALLQQKRNMFLSAWHTALIERSNIQDFRYYFLD